MDVRVQTELLAGASISASAAAWLSRRWRFSLVLLVGAILFVRSLKNILSVNAGFHTAGIMEADLNLRQLKIPARQRQGYKLNLIDRLRALPGVEGVADASVVPLSGYGWQEHVILAGAAKRADVAPLFTQVSPDFFNTMGIGIMAGRAFSEPDTANSLKVVSSTRVS
jgi:hypothetical protein